MEHKKTTVLKVIRIVMKLMPVYLPTLSIAKLFAAGQPFVNIIFGSMILDMIVQKDPVSDVMRYIIMMVTYNLFIGLSRWALDKVIIVQKRIISERISQIICEKSLTLDYEVLEKKDTLEMIYKAEEGIHNYGDIGEFCSKLGNLLEQICKIIYSVWLLVGVFVPVSVTGLKGFSSVINQWYSGAFVIIILILTLLATYYLKRWIGKQEQKNFEDNVEGNRRFNYFFGFIYHYAIGKDIRLYRMKDMIMDEIKKDNIRCEQITKRILNGNHKATVMGNIIGMVFEGSSYIYVGLKAIFGLISIGSVLKYVSALRELSNGLTGILEVYIAVEIQSRYLAYFSDFLAIKNRKYEGTLPVEKRDDNEYVIEFRDVSFHYPNSEEMVLSHVNATLHVKRKMALVGKNGAGKTTFIKLLCRLYDPSEGEILLNGIDIKLYDYREYMKLFSIVFQDFQLFSFSLAENVATSLEFDDDRIYKCLEKAGFIERLQSMPNGIKTNIYQLQEEGVELSGGEAQKIAIARALYKDSPIVVLDEPTSALDPVSEYDIYRRFDDLVREKTAIYISHRMSSCRFCDRIVVFDEGNIVQTGSHEELLKEKENIYYQLWNAQAQYYA